MNPIEKAQPLLVLVQKPLHTSLKLMAVQHGTTMSDIVRRLVTEELARKGNTDFTKPKTH